MRPSYPLSTTLTGKMLRVAALGLLLGNALDARPEGSVSLYPAGYSGVNASRANLDVSGAGAALYVNTVRAGTFLYVFAQAGEYILVGSSNQESGSDILVYQPQNFGTPGNEKYDNVTTGTPDFSCAAVASPPTKYSGGTLGRLSTRVQELAGPNSANNTVLVTNGFSPCAYQAPVTGIYGVLFRAPAGGAAADGVVNPSGPFPAAVGAIAAWDVTVRSSATSTINLDGRLFTYALAAAMGGNSRSFYSRMYYVTGDGYRYRQQWQGLDPASYVLYSNTFGFLDNGQPLYRDLRGNEQRVTSLPAGVTSQIAQNPLFFSNVASGAPTEPEVVRVLNALSIPLTAPTPTVSSVAFAGNVSGTTSTTGAGGTFTFDSTDTISYQIVISLNGVNFDPENAANRVLTGIAYPGSHAIRWDGRNNALAAFPAGGPYSYILSGRNGEVHFPLVDSENNAWGGPTITRLNGVGSPSTIVYYDDRGYATRSGVLVGQLNGTLCPTGTPPPPVPVATLNGIDSAQVTGTLSGQSTYARNWGVTSRDQQHEFGLHLDQCLGRHQGRRRLVVLLHSRDDVVADHRKHDHRCSDHRQRARHGHGRQHHPGLVPVREQWHRLCAGCHLHTVAKPGPWRRHILQSAHGHHRGLQQHHRIRHLRWCRVANDARAGPGGAWRKRPTADGVQLCRPRQRLYDGLRDDHHHGCGRRSREQHVVGGNGHRRHRCGDERGRASFGIRRHDHLRQFPVLQPGCGQRRRRDL